MTDLEPPIPLLPSLLPVTLVSSSWPLQLPVYDGVKTMMTVAKTMKTVRWWLHRLQQELAGIKTMITGEAKKETIS